MRLLDFPVWQVLLGYTRHKGVPRVSRLEQTAKPSSFAFIRGRIDDQTWRAIVARYVWWETPEEAAIYPERVIARTMNMGDFDDIERIARLLGDAMLRDVVTHAQAGWFDERSWHYWHYRLGLCDLGAVPPLPRRALA